MAPFPSIEYIYRVEMLEKNEVAYSNNVILNMLSKGIYSAQMMKVLQEEPILIGTAGGFAGKYIKHYLDKSKVKSDIVWTDYETPHRVKINLTADQAHYALQTKEEIIFDREMQRLTQKMNQHIKKVSTLVISGQLPEGVDHTLYGKWIEEAKKHNVKVLISVGQRDVLEKCIEQKPFALMFTEEQLIRLGFPNTQDEVIASMIPLLEGGIHYIGIYFKDRPSMMLSKHKYCLIDSPFRLIDKNNTAASGAFLGAFAVGINRKYEVEKFSKLCLSAALSAKDNVSQQICCKKDIDIKIKKIKIREYIS